MTKLGFCTKLCDKIRIRHTQAARPKMESEKQDTLGDIILWVLSKLVAIIIFIIVATIVVTLSAVHIF